MTTALVNNNRQPTWQVTPQAGLQVNSVAVSPDGQLTVGGTSSEFGTGQFNFYGFAATGQQLWSVAVTATNVTQGIFWVAVSDDKRFAACGGETSKTCGFLCIVDASNGDILFQDNSLPARVNQLSFTSDGTVLLADFQHELRLYSFAPASAAATPSWAQTDLIALPVDFSSYSAVLAGNGSRAWVAAINYNVKPVYTGIVQQIAVANGKFGAATCYEQTQGVMRIVTTNDGAYAAAALHDGSCAFFQAAQATTAFVYKPDLANLNIAYARCHHANTRRAASHCCRGKSRRGWCALSSECREIRGRNCQFSALERAILLESVGAVCGKSWGDVRCCGHSCHGHRRQTG